MAAGGIGWVVYRAGGWLGAGYTFYIIGLFGASMSLRSAKSHEWGIYLLSTTISYFMSI